MSIRVDGIVENRQKTHISSLDSAYLDGYSNLRNAAGFKPSESNLLADSYHTYVAYRQVFLRKKLEDLHQFKAADTRYMPNNRFSLPFCGGLDAPVQQSAVVSRHSAVQQTATGYMVWRRAILANKFEKQRRLLTEDQIHRQAADAIERAMKAEQEARDEYREILEEKSHDYAMDDPCNDEDNWVSAGSVSTYDKIEDSSIQKAMAALGLPVGRRAGAPAAFGDDARALRPSPQNYSLALAMFGPQTDRIGARNCSVVSFAPALPLRALAPGSPLYPVPSLFAVGTDCGSVHLCAVGEAQEWLVLSNAHVGPVTCLDWSFSENRLFLLSAGADGVICVWYVVPPVNCDGSALRLYKRRDSVVEKTSGGRRTRSVDPASFSLSNISSSRDNGRTKKRSGKSGDVEDSRSQSQPPSRRRVRMAAKVERERSNLRAKLGSSANAALQSGGDAVDSDVDKRVQPRGGSARLLKQIQTDYALSFAVFHKKNPSIVIATGLDFGEFAESYSKAEALRRSLGRGAFLPLVTAMNSSFGSSELLDPSKAQTGSSASQNTLGISSLLRTMNNTIKSTTAIVNITSQSLLTSATSLIPATQLLSQSRQKLSRGLIIAVNVLRGTIMQTRPVQGALVDTASLRKTPSVATAACLTLDGSGLLLADARGLLHLYRLEQDPKLLKLLLAGQPGAFDPSNGSYGSSVIKQHSVLYGETSKLVDGFKKWGINVKSAINSSAAPVSSSAFPNTANNNNSGSTTSTNSSSIIGQGNNKNYTALLSNSSSSSSSQTGTGSSTTSNEETDSDAVFLTSLACKYDPILRSPIIVGLGSDMRVHAFTYPASASASASTDSADSNGGASVGVASEEGRTNGSALANEALNAAAGATSLLLRTTVGVATLGTLQIGLEAKSQVLDGLLDYVNPGPAHFGFSADSGSQRMVVVTAAGELYILAPHSGARSGTTAERRKHPNAFVAARQVAARLYGPEGVRFVAAHTDPEGKFVVAFDTDGGAHVFRLSERALALNERYKLLQQSFLTGNPPSASGSSSGSNSIGYHSGSHHSIAENIAINQNSVNSAAGVGLHKPSIIVPNNTTFLPPKSSAPTPSRAPKQSPIPSHAQTPSSKAKAFFQSIRDEFE